MEWWPSLKLTVRIWKLAIRDKWSNLTIFFGGWKQLCLQPNEWFVLLFCWIQFLCKLHRLPMWAGPWNWGSSVFLEFHPKKPIGIIFTYQKCRSGRRQSTWTLGFVAPFEALEVLDALRKHWLEQSLGPMHEPSPVPGLQEEISVGWGLGSWWVEWRNTSFSTWAHAKYTKKV